MDLPLNQIIHGDCLEVMPLLSDKSIDMILCDLPYGTTDCKWDSIIPLESLWEQYKRIIKNNGAIVLTAREPFTSILISSNIKAYKHKWVWNKKQSGSFQNAKYMPLQIEEDVIVFGYERVSYYPQMRKGKLRKKGGCKKRNEVASGLKQNHETYNDLYYPVNIIEIINPRLGKMHPTQKPVELFEYLIQTYTKEGELVLDNCIGSGTTAIAALNTGRFFIGIEKEEKYVEIAKKRVSNLQQKLFIV